MILERFSDAVRMADFFIYRAAAQKIEQLRAWNGLDRESTRTLLVNWLKNEGVSEAIFLASPSLYERLSYWYDKPESKQGKKVEIALVKYFIRMTSRSTPFGLFAGVGMGSLSDNSQLDLSIGELKRRFTRLDMGFIASLQTLIASNPESRDVLSYRRNPSLYLVGDNWRYIEAYNEKDNRYYRLSSVENDEFLRFVIDTSNIPILLRTLAKRLCSLDPEIDMEEAKKYLCSLIDENILVPDLPMPLVGERVDDTFVSTLQMLPNKELLRVYQYALSQVKQLDNCFVNPLDNYHAVFSSLKAILPDSKINNLLQVDYFHSSSSVTLSKAFAKNVVDDLASLNRLTISQDNLRNFKERYNKRFEGKAVPLNRLMDDEIGIGYSQNKGFESPLIGTIPFISSGTSDRTQSAKQFQIEQLLLKKLLESRVAGEQEIILTDKDLEQFSEQDTNNVPFSFSCMMTLLASNEEALDSGEFKVICSSLSGPSAANLIGRFCHLDEAMESDVKQLLQFEESAYPDAILAEIVHLPQGRIGNVIARPVLRAHEIPFMTDSSVDKTFQIDINDLWVFIGQQGRVVLWSKGHNKEIIPRLSSAHNYANNSLGLYTFLCSLQRQQHALPGFSWGAIFGKQEYLPRVMIGRLVCSLQTWRIRSDEWLKFKGLEEEIFKENIDIFKEKYKLPDWISYSVGDNSLQICLGNMLLVETFLNELKKGQLVSVTEVLSEELPLAMKHNDSYLQHEFIIPFIKSGEYKTQFSEKHDFSNKSSIKQDVIPGGEWLMLKIYAGNKTSEYLLIEKLGPLIRSFVAESADEELTWFFMRYGDPDWHIRLRFHSDQKNLYQQIQPRLNILLDTLFEQGLVASVEHSTYQREMSRYGGEHGMLLSEKLFQYDSECCLSLIAILNEQPADIRWQAALIGCHKMLIDFGFDESKRHEIIKQQRKGFGAEFGDFGLLKKEIGSKYRVYQDSLKSIMFSDAHDDVFNEITTFFALRSSKFSPVVNSLIIADKNKLLTVSLEEIAKSFLHMFMNRIFVSNARQQELLVYDFLDRLYKYSIHREKDV